jgi:AcrR family transcriptional regulator
MTKERKRGRPRSFDETAILDKIMQVFWEHGYSATSLDQIAEATNLNRPSLYAAFGSKKDMYLKVINRFADMMQAHLSAAGNFDGPLNARFKAVLSAAIDLYTGKTPVSASRFGCLAISTLPAESTQDPEFVEALNKVMGRMDRGFARLIETGSKNRFNADEAAQIGQQFAVMLHGISVRARAGENTKSLKALAGNMVDRLLPGDSG